MNVFIRFIFIQIYIYIYIIIFYRNIFHLIKNFEKKLFWSIYIYILIIFKKIIIVYTINKYFK